MTAVPTPFLFLAGTNSVCDTAESDCAVFLVHGQDLVQSPHLSCRLGQVKADSNTSWSYVGRKLDSRVQFQSQQKVRCAFDRAALEVVSPGKDLILQVEVRG